VRLGLCVAYDVNTVTMAEIDEKGKWVNVLPSAENYIEEVKHHCKKYGIDITTEEGRERLWQTYDGSRVWIGKIEDL